MKQTIAITTQSDSVVLDTRKMPFGTVPTAHMFIAEYSNGVWNEPRIVPYQNLSLSPMTMCLHYGQTVFEGMKAFRTVNNDINIFRIKKHSERFNKSLFRMCMPSVPEELFTNAITSLVRLDSEWVPTDADGALYIRPFMIATEERIGLKVSDEYLFMVVCSPSFAYYTQPLRIKVETSFVRAASGGTGAAKCGGNYGGSFYPASEARKLGYDQVLWTDSATNTFIEESGTMNALFYIDGRLITPSLSDSILDGVTRDTLLTIARDLGVIVEERKVLVAEIKEALQAGKKVEAFGAGTAAVVAPIASIGINGVDYNCYTDSDAFMYQLKNQLLSIRSGEIADKHNWNCIL